MSRLSQALAYIDSIDVSPEWIKVNLTDITVSDELKKLRKTRLNENRQEKNKRQTRQSS